ncbi:phage tail tube protein [Brevibacillus daliensis]|uniref:phage tail tube protein n=1 Tax=Brevibacillus daliensis TaxID=2892995 RepID=UPI001E28E8E8|nr:phage tail tube protein [Brevibacillus daliensis]
MDSTKVVNGAFCKVYHDGVWLTYVTSFSASVSVSYEDIKRAGTRWVGKKATSLSGEGSMTGYKLTHDLTKLISRVGDDVSSPYVTELLVEVNDPESPQAKAFIRFKQVQFEAVPILDYEVNSVVEEELNFTFSGFEFV